MLKNYTIWVLILPLSSLFSCVTLNVELYSQGSITPDFKNYWKGKVNKIMLF